MPLRSGSPSPRLPVDPLLKQRAAELQEFLEMVGLSEQPKNSCPTLPCGLAFTRLLLEGKEEAADQRQAAS